MKKYVVSVAVMMFFCGQAVLASARIEKDDPTFVFEYYGEIPVVQPVFAEEHEFGTGISEKWNTFLQNYTREYDVTVGFTDTSFELVKPTIYKAVIKADKYYRKALRKKTMDRDEAMSGLAHVLDCANVLCFEDQSEDFETALKTANRVEEIVALFQQVSLVKK